MGIRLPFLAIGIFLAYGGLLFHLYGVQVAESEYYLAEAESQYAALSLSLARRGTVYFTGKEGERVAAATTKEFPLIYAVPEAMDDPSEAAHQLAPVLGTTPEELSEEFSRRGATYVPLVKKAPPELVRAIEEADVDGVYVERIPGRFYPFGALAAHLLGFVGPNTDDYGESGKYGIERAYDDTLRGTAGRIEENSFTPPVHGEDVVLTVDPTIQTEAERILEALVKRYNAKGGSVIVEEPKTGKILAMGSVPAFDPNAYGVSDIKTFLNPAVQGMYEPGSVFKVITMAAGIDSGSVTPNTTYYDTGSVTASGYTIRNWDHKAYGRMTTTNILEKSLNTGSAFVERTTGHTTFQDYVKRFGFGEKTEIFLPGEIPGDLGTLYNGAPEINFVTGSFGQGVAVTPLQLVNAFSAIANGGKLMRPYVDARNDPHVVREVISPISARTVTEMIISAVDKAEVARIPGYAVAGKTGTAFIPNFGKGGYTERVINTYAGFAPATDARFVIVVKLDEPEGAPVAALTVVPAFRNLAQFILNYYNIPPDRIE